MGWWGSGRPRRSQYGRNRAGGLVATVWRASRYTRFLVQEIGASRHGSVDERLRAGQAGLTGSDLDREFDSIYRNILAGGFDLSVELERRIAARQAAQDLVHRTIVILVIVLFLILTVTVWHGQRATRPHGRQ